MIHSTTIDFDYTNNSRRAPRWKGSEFLRIDTKDYSQYYIKILELWWGSLWVKLLDG